MTNPWDATPFPPKGDETSKVTFQAVGEALSQWEHFEGYLSLIYANLVGTGDTTEPAVLSYGTVVSFKGRADMIRAAANGFFFRKPDEILQEELKAILKLADNFSPRRNEIAHGIVQPYVPDGARAVDGFALVPAYYATNKRVLGTADAGIAPLRMKPKYAYTSAEIKYFKHHFSHLTDRATQLLPKLQHLAFA
jgi:hypothetical protein